MLALLPGYLPHHYWVLPLNSETRREDADSADSGLLGQADKFYTPGVA